MVYTPVKWDIMVPEALQPGETVPSEFPSPLVADSPHQPAVEVGWVTPFSPAIWEEFSRLDKEAANLGGSEVSVEEDGTVSLGPVFGDDADPRVGMVHASRHSTDTLAWSLRIGTISAQELPESARNIHEHFKGRRGLVEMILKACSRGALPIASYKINFSLNPEHWHCNLLPRPATEGSPDARVLGICTGAAMEYVGYKLQNGVYGIDEFSIASLDDDTQVYDVLVIARSPLKLAPDRWLPFADDVCELIASMFFEQGKRG